VVWGLSHWALLVWLVPPRHLTSRLFYTYLSITVCSYCLLSAQCVSSHWKSHSLVVGVVCPHFHFELGWRTGDHYCHMDNMLLTIKSHSMFVGVVHPHSHIKLGWMLGDCYHHSHASRLPNTYTPWLLSTHLIHTEHQLVINGWLPCGYRPFPLVITEHPLCDHWCLQPQSHDHMTFSSCDHKGHLYLP
jgi:hypothetical protein